VAACSLFIVVNKDVEQGHGAEDECLQGAVQPHERYWQEWEYEDVRTSSKSAEKFVVMLVVDSLLHQLQVVWC